MIYDNFKQRFELGEILVGVSPAEARKFFADTSRSKVQNLLGERLFRQYFIVKTLFWIHWLILLTNLVFLGLAVQWWSFLAIPVVLFMHIFGASKATLGNQTPGRTFIFLIVFIVIAFIWLKDYLWLQLFISTMPLSLLILKLMYISAITFIRELIIINPKMFEMVSESGLLILKDTVNGVTYSGPNLQHTY